MGTFPGQWILDYWAERRASQPQERPEAPLEVPGFVWNQSDDLRRLHGWRPPEYVPAPDPRQDWQQSHARALAAEVLARVPQSFIRDARAALDACMLAATEVNRLEAEQRANEAPATEEAALAALLLPKRLAGARKAAEVAATRAEEVVSALRTELTQVFDATIRERERLISREQDEQASELQRQAGDRRIAVINARSLLNGFIPPNNNQG